MKEQQEKAVFVMSQYDINRLQKMLENEREKRRREWVGYENDSFDNATVVVPMKVYNGNYYNGLHCAVDTVGAIEEGKL